MTTTELTYTNAYEPFSEQCFREECGTIPAYILKKCEEKVRLSTLRVDHATAFIRPIVIQCVEGRMTPEIAKLNKYGKEEIYLNVYGRRPSVTLTIRDQEAISEWFTPHYLSNVVHRMRELEIKTIVDAKIVHKFPFNHAAEGSLYHLKLYFGGTKNPELWRLRKMLREDFTIGSLFLPDLLNSSITPHTQWFIANRASVLGTIIVNGPIGAKYLHSRHPFKSGTAYYKDIRFETNSDLRIPWEDRGQHTEAIRHKFDAILETCSSPALKAVLRHNLNKVSTCAGQGCTWQEFKAACVYPILVCGRSSPGIEIWRTTMHRLWRDISNTTDRIDEHEHEADVLAEQCRIEFNLRLAAKCYWEKVMVSQYFTDRQRTARIEQLLTNTKLLRAIYFDIEVSYIPHCRDESSFEVNLISTVLSNHMADKPVEAVNFMLLAGRRQDGGREERAATNLNVANICRISSQGIKEPIFDESNVVMRYFKTETHLLSAFIDYVRNCKCHIVGYFNGHKFDLPFIVARLKYLKMTNYISYHSKVQMDNESRPRHINFSLTNRLDQIQIKYRRKPNKKNFRDVGVELRAKGIERARGPVNNVITDEDLDQLYEQTALGESNVNHHDWDNMLIIDENGPDSYPLQSTLEEAEATSQSGEGSRCAISKAMVLAKQHRNLASHTVALLDVMLEVGDPNRGCKLETAAEKWLNTTKVHDEKVTYENMTNTWRNGSIQDLELFCGYCLKDSGITCALTNVLQTLTFAAGMAEISSLPYRELFLNEMVRTVMSCLASFSYRQGVYMPDTTIIRDEGPLWMPGHEFDEEVDMYRLAVPAGRTVQNKGLYSLLISVLDFSGQYPSIQRAHGICATTLVRKSFAKNQLNPDQYTTVELHNVRPVVEHACQDENCGGEVGGSKDPRLCKYTHHFERVNFDVYYAKPNIFNGIMPQFLEIMAAMRTKYKKQMAQATDSIEKGLFNVLQKSVKCAMNATYGVSVRTAPPVGSSITQVGRDQIELVARKAKEQGMNIVNGDTDSVMISDINATSGAAGRMTCLSNNLCGRNRASVTEIFTRYFEKQEQFCSYLNSIFPSPCKIELEKVFLFQCMFQKKCYYGQKVIPGSLALVAHKAGITGMKADRTKVKSAAQIATSKMVGRNDINGLVEFAQLLYELVTVRMRAQEIADQPINDFCDLIDYELEDFYQNLPTCQKMGEQNIYVPQWRKRVTPSVLKQAYDESCEVRENLKRLDETETHQTLVDKYSHGDLIPLDWMKSVEKVGDINNPKTLATKQAIRDCKRRGVDVCTAQTFVDMYRKHDVQVSATLKNSLQVLLHAPEEPDVRYRREQIERKELGEKAWSAERKKRLLRESRLETASNTISRLSVTAMPKCLIAPDEQRTYFTEKERAKIYHVIKKIESWDKKIEHERKSGFKEIIFDLPKKPNEADIAQLRMYIEDLEENEPHVPIWWYDEDYCITEPPEPDLWWPLPDSGSVCDFWCMFAKTDLSRRYIHISGGPVSRIMLSNDVLPGARYLDVDQSSWNKKDNVYSVSMTDTTECYSLDMGKRYAAQTRSTPFLVTSIDGKHRYLTNKDSFCRNTRNRFSFATQLCQLITVKQRLAPSAYYYNDIITLYPKRFTDRVIIQHNSTLHELTDVVILRDDNRCVTKWLFEDGPFYLRLGDLHNIIQAVQLPNQPARLKVIELRFIEYEGNSGTLRVERAVDVQQWAYDISRDPHTLPPFERKDIFDIFTSSCQCDTKKRPLQIPQGIARAKKPRINIPPKDSTRRRVSKCVDNKKQSSLTSFLKAKE
uniref:DNA polymerase delta catalytic subunit n=1 Tax=Branchiostoma floridae TaxID=7739 RepID=C3ZJN9_BRAFL|eukprot:XP_002591163.1 hypothetical protein BRAFLDRAFT_105365 [Branchiostoma floridae]